MKEALGTFDRDESFWREIRELPEDVKQRPELMEMLQFKVRVQQLNRDIEDAIRLRLAGWTASLPNGEALEPDRVYSWQWRRPGPRGGQLFLSTQQAINALTAQAAHETEESDAACEPENRIAKFEVTKPTGARAF